MRLQIIVILLAIVGVATGLAQLGEESVTITVTSEGKAKISQTLFPKTFVSTIDVHIISEKISNLLAIDEKNILLGTTQNQELLKIATLGASAVDLKYNAEILTYESGVFRLKYGSELESKVNLPPLSKLVSLNTIPIEITDKEYTLPPGDISLSYTIRPVTSKEFFVTVDDSEQKIEVITAAKVEEFSTNKDEIQFIIKDKAIALTIIPKTVMTNPNDALLNGEEVDFSQFHQNATHSWIRIDPHEKGLVRILDTSEELGGCLIATAAYGSELAPQVQFLREIRDNQLMNTDSGVLFMTGFNQLYYSFSPYIADMQRENPMFKELVKIAITPMLSSLSVMTIAESESEIVGLGVGVILLNIAMYFVLPFVIFYQIMKIMRTNRAQKSNWMTISRYNVISAVKKSIFSIVALLVLTVSVSSAFETAYADEAGAIQVILNITYENIQESFVDAGIDPAEDPVFLAAQEDYFEALAALEAGDIAAAEDNALSAMELFEISAENIGELLEVQEATIQPLGLGIAAASIFNVQEGITNSDNEANELRELIKINNFDDVDFSAYDESVNLAKTLLADGYVPDAQAQLALANDIKNNLYGQIDAAVVENQDERVQEFVDSSKDAIEEMLENGENLGLTKKAIKELEDVLEAIENGQTDEVLDKTDDDSELAKELDGDETPEDAPGNSGEAPGQNKGEGDAPGNSGEAPGQNKGEGDAPGNSGEAPGQNKDNDESGLPPGFGAAGDNPVDEAIENGQGLGLGKIPPGLAKLFGYDDGTGDNEDFETPEGLPPGFGAAGDNPSENGLANGQGLGLGNIPPGQLKKFDASVSFVYSPDDYFEDAIDDLIEDTFEDNYDKIYKNSKAKEKKLAQEALGKANAIGNSGGGNPNCSNEGVTDNDPANTSGTINVPYLVEDFTAVGSSCQVAQPSQINIQVTAPVGPPPFVENINQGETFTATEAGTYTISASFQGQFGTRVVIITDPNIPPTASGTATTPISEGTSTTLDGTADDPDGDNLNMTFLWEIISGNGGSITPGTETLEDATFNAPIINGGGPDIVFTFTLTVTDELAAQTTSNVVTITVLNDS